MFNRIKVRSPRNIADFGMALPFFIEDVEFNVTTIASGPGVARGEIGQVFGERTVVVIGATVDGQLWRAIYPDETSSCWVMPSRKN